MKRRLTPPPTVYKQGHVELIQHRAHLLQIPDRTVYTPRTCGRHEEVGKGKGNFGEKQKLGKHLLLKEMDKRKHSLNQEGIEEVSFGKLKSQR